MWRLDLLSFASVRALAARARALPRLDVVLMGAAVITPARTVSRHDGWEATLQVNHLSSALLSLLLLPVLETSPGDKPVLAAVSSMSVWTSSWTMPAPRDGRSLLEAVDTNSSYLQHRQQYGATKLLHLYWLRELAARLGNHGSVVVQACDFGVSNSPAGIATINRRRGSSAPSSAGPLRCVPAWLRTPAPRTKRPTGGCSSIMTLLRMYSVILIIIIIIILPCDVSRN